MADPRVTLHLGDCLDVLKGLPDESFDAIVTDPPAGIAFMGKRWDTFKRDRFIDFLRDRLAECYRIARPGACALIWAIPRTSHWTGMAIEDAGWRIEDRVSHLFGTGFPKHKSKLKPACEDWWLAIKPAGKAVPLEIDRCRIEGPAWSKTDGDAGSGFKSGKFCGVNGRGEPTHADGPRSAAGRWPANVVLSHSPGCREVGTKRVKVARSQPSRGANQNGQIYGGGQGINRSQVGQSVGYADPDGFETVPAWECEPNCAIRLLDEQSGTSGEKPRVINRNGIRQMDGWRFRAESKGTVHADFGGASRFFYCAKASRADRGEGNTHPTVKNSDLMRWLVRLITPPGGSVLDPFAGSGSTGKACIAEGFDFTGIESDPDHFATAERRLAAARSACPLFPAEPTHARP